VTPSRTVIVGSALPLLILVGLVGIPSAWPSADPERPTAARSGPSPSSTDSSAEGGLTPAQAAAQARSEALALTWLRRSIRSGRELGFTGTEVVTAWHPGGSTSQVLDLVQTPGGGRIASEHDTSFRAKGPDRVTQVPAVSPDVLAGLSERALNALAADYQLRLGGRDEVAGRSTTMIIASQDGREVARMWLDDQTGLLLRQEVLDRAGKLHRMAAFLELRPTAEKPGTVTGTNSTPANRTIAAVARNDIPLSGMARWRAEGWPCPDRLAEGFVLLDAQRETTSSGAPVLHLTYGDGLSAISVFLQRGQLDDGRLAGMTSQRWGDAVVHVRTGWPEVMVWQGGPTVITAVGDAEPDELRAVLSTLPRQPDRGRLASLQGQMGSAFSWFKR
jgi:negative regulator of sigma E activity